MAENHPVVLITGAAKRLGAHTACYLHQHGYNIVIHYHRSQTNADKLVEQLNQQRHNSACAVQADLISGDMQQLAEQAIVQWGRLDVLINNASSFYPTPLDTATKEQWNDLIGTNLQAPLWLSQACAPQLKANKGCIINMIDTHHNATTPNHPIYHAAKAGLAGLTRTLAFDLAPDIRVNGIAPGAILWPEQSSTEYEQKILEKIPLQRIGSADDIAQATHYLATADYVTGQIIAIDGGRSLNR